MLDALKPILPVIVLLALVAGCASSPPAVPRPGEAARAGAAPEDSAAAEAYEEIFLELHSELLGELGRKETGGAPDAHVIEARAIVQIAEEIYLEGNVLLAIQLLNEAEHHLRQAP